ncbi:MAG: hypothetical protein ABWX60_08715 [Aeromicrobium sp.]
MSHGRLDLRFDAPPLEPSDDLVHRLAAAARTSSVTVAMSRRRHRLVVAIAAFLGISAVSVGGAWAVGAIDVPGIPSSPLREAVVTPDPPPPRNEQGGAPGGDADTGSGVVGGPVTPDLVGPGASVDRETDVAARDDEPSPAAEGAAADAPAKDKDRGQGHEKENGQGQGETRSQDKGENGQHRGQGKQKEKQKEKQKAKQDRGNGASADAKDRGQGAGRSASKPAPEDEDPVDGDE